MTGLPNFHLPVTLARNATVAKLVDPVDPKVKAFVTQLLGYEVAGQLGWSGKSSFLNVIRNTFPAGFTNVVVEELKRTGYTVNLVQRPHATPLGPENPIVDEFGNDDPDYDYQMKALRQIEKHGAGVIRVATGGGKSKIAKLIMARYRRMTLFLTTRGILLYQMKEQVDAMGIKTGVIGDGQINPVGGINLGMVQTLVASLKEPDLNAEIRAIIASDHSRKGGTPNRPRAVVEAEAQAIVARKTARRAEILQVLGMVEVVIGEEAHEVGGESYYEIMRHCTNATIRVALTATPFMRDSAVDNMRLMAGFGSILIDVSEETLINRGILAKPYFVFRDVPAKGMFKSTPWERALKVGYTANEAMHDALLADALKAAQLGLPVLALVGRKEWGTTLRDLYKSAGLRVSFLKGENDQAERKRDLDRLAGGQLDAVIGTTIVDVGVDVPAIGLVQLAGGGKAEVALRQRIGRGLRRKKRGPNVTFIADYSANQATVLREHAFQRRRIIEGTPGFVEGIMPDGQDLPWTLFEKAT